ncbi:MAG: hypothetical protein ACHP79_08145, partial [Terriglobales bacterium]
MTFFGTLMQPVDELDKMLKTKAFNPEKFLDTAIQGPIRFLPESSDGFLKIRLNYSPLKEKAVPLPGGLFVLPIGEDAHPALARAQTRRCPLALSVEQFSFFPTLWELLKNSFLHHTLLGKVLPTLDATRDFCNPLLKLGLLHRFVN